MVLGLGLISMIAGTVAFVFFQNHSNEKSNVVQLNSFMMLRNDIQNLGSIPYKYPLLTSEKTDDGIGSVKKYKYVIGSARLSNQIIYYGLRNEDGLTINVTTQAKPANFALDDYPGRIQLNTFAGRGIIGNNSDFTSAALFTDESITFLRSDEVVDDDTLRDILGSYRLD